MNPGSFLLLVNLPLAVKGLSYLAGSSYFLYYHPTCTSFPILLLKNLLGLLVVFIAGSQRIYGTLFSKLSTEYILLATVIKC